jgi:hypothetical protein
MTTWGELKQQILFGLLRDEQGERYTDEQMRTYARWALAELSAHTAASDSRIYELDGRQVPLPTDLVEPIEKSGLVIYRYRQVDRYLVAHRRMPGVVVGKSHEQVYFEFPAGVLTLGFEPDPSSQLILHYFRIWRTPLSDDDRMEIPQFLELPFAYFVAAFALEPVGTQAANVRQWNRRQDSGTPEDNPALQQVRHFISQAYRVLGRYAPQDRETFYRMTPEGAGWE